MMETQNELPSLGRASYSPTSIVTEYSVTNSQKCTSPYKYTFLIHRILCIKNDQMVHETTLDSPTSIVTEFSADPKNVHVNHLFHETTLDVSIPMMVILRK